MMEKTTVQGAQDESSPEGYEPPRLIELGNLAELTQFNVSVIVP